VAYTGTHDNDTAVGWYAATDDATRHRFRRYTGRDGGDVAWGLLREAWASIATLAVAPMQDVLGLGSEARMNTPGLATGNWAWRLRELPWERCAMMRSLAKAFGRAGLAED
jgi:4-alpha-glucanotransferase